MTVPIIAVRPQPGCDATVAAGRALGLLVDVHPLFAVEPVAWQAPDPSTVDALLVGSANVFRHGGFGPDSGSNPGLTALAGKPVYAVGQATAQAARDAGFAVAATGNGGLQGVLDHHVPPGTALLRLAGEEHVDLILPAGTGVTMETRITYASRAAPMADSLARQLAQGGAWVLLHSAAAARHLAAEVDRLGVPRAAVSLAVLGPRISAAAGGGWAQIACAERPDDAALLALFGKMCH